MKIQIKNRFDLSLIFECEADSIGIAVNLAIKAKADLRSADLRYADLSYADLSYADLRSANLSYADLTVIKHDFWAVLVCAYGEISFLRKALIEGKVNGSQYQGECACLVGTIANAKKINYESLELLKPDSSRPAERFFLSIAKGDTPETNQFSKLAVEWLDEFVRNTSVGAKNANQA